MLLVVAVTGVVMAGTRSDRQPTKKGQAPMKIATRGDAVKIEVNSIATYIRNNGSFNRDPGTGGSGFEWPKGSGNTANYASGLWLGGQVGTDARVAVAEYAYEYDAGPIAPGVSAEDSKYRVYSIRAGDNASNNTDYADWPFDDGAPAVRTADGTADSLTGSGSRIPKLTGDETIFCVFNDNNPNLHTNMNTAPLGLEVQLTAFAYDRSDALGNNIFYKWKIVNKGGNNITNAFVTVWTDIDLGDSGDDYDGCDTTLGLGYTYNQDPVDGVYGVAVPATGFDFLQGPLVDGAATDTARFPDGRIFPGKKLLKMTSFVKYSNDASDYGNPNTGQEVLNYMQGLTRSGLQILDDLNQPARFMFPGDPNFAYDAATNWIEQGAGGDRRFMMSAGPFTMAPGEEQEIVAANLIAQGSDYHNSVTALKVADLLVQTAYDLNFRLAPPPPPPTVVAVPQNRAVVLSWGEDDPKADLIESYTAVDPLAGLAGKQDSVYEFEGYVVYQVANRSGDFPKVLAVYDLVNGIKEITDKVVDPNLGPITSVVKKGNDNGIRRTLRITQDKYTNGPLVDDKDYYFLVTSYAFNDSSIPRTLESSRIIHTVRPTKLPGARLNLAYGDTSSVVHVSGISDAAIVPKVIDPSRLTGHQYEIRVDTTEGITKWLLTDLTTGDSLLTSTNFGPGKGGNNYAWPERDGVQWAVYNVEDRPNPDRSTFVGGDWAQSIRWENVPPAVVDPTDNGIGIFTIGTDLPNFLGHMDPSFSPADEVPIEVRFGPGETQKAYRMRRVGGVGTAYVIQATNPFVDVPFTVWDMSNPASPRQLTTSWRDQDNSATYNPPEDDDGVEIVFIHYRTYNASGGQWPYQGCIGCVPADWSDQVTVGANADIMYAMSLGLVAGHTLGEDTSKFVVIPLVGLKLSDVYHITPAAPTKNAALKKADVNNILAVPNPYFATNAYERNQFNRVVRFTNLPKQDTIRIVIRIFNLAGDMVKVIDRDVNDPLTTSDWDLTNANDLPVASGMYIVYIDIPGVGTRILKVAVVMPEERLDNF